MKTLIILLVWLCSCSGSKDVSLTGHWEGKMISGGKSLDISFDISKDRFLFDIPELGLFGVPAENWKVDGEDLTIDIQGKENILVEGSVSGNSITAGIDGNEDINIELSKRSDVPVFYEEEDLTYLSSGVSLSGTLIKPHVPGPYPVIIYVHGSGKMTRETMRSRAYMLVKEGFAAFIFDRRGKGKSEGDTSRILPISVMTNDVISSVELLRNRNDIDKNRIGIYGLSQGAWVAPNAASLCKDISFIITISAPGITPDEQNEFVVNNIVSKYIYRSFEGNNWTGREFADSIFQKEDVINKMNGKNNTEVVPGFSRFDPLPAWQMITVPVLALWGENDRIVPPVKSMENIRKALLDGGNKAYTLKIFEGADHSLKLESEEDKFSGKWSITAPGSNEYLIEWLKKTVKKQN